MIKVVNKKGLQRRIEFPKLMKSLGLIVFFHKEGKGTVLQADSTHDVGDYFEDWIMTKFEDYNEELTIKNK